MLHKLLFPIVIIYVVTFTLFWLDLFFKSFKLTKFAKYADNVMHIISAKDSFTVDTARCGVMGQFVFIMKKNYFE